MQVHASGCTRARHARILYGVSLNLTYMHLDNNNQKDVIDRAACARRASDLAYLASFCAWRPIPRSTSHPRIINRPTAWSSRTCRARLSTRIAPL
eukprot:3389403-Alexandrium_andersonii.AAC.1